jgi:hypothetical protein
MPCTKKMSRKQRGLFFATKEWHDWSGIKRRKKR